MQLLLLYMLVFHCHSYVELKMFQSKRKILPLKMLIRAINVIVLIEIFQLIKT